ncbi:aliphatic sulfonate ABC transporter substrate-binding protein (plasmid) [Deltaproteobacteria bacterium Smac51]|nr:aliphatic sulfonate ABC transporter substrate-binding protein [Deltaproteobacteria bacterium Smac51]
MAGAGLKSGCLAGLSNGSLLMPDPRPWKPSLPEAWISPNPALNAFIRSRGGLMVLSGAVRGGGGLVVPQKSELSSPDDFRGKTIATPQLGNTQDVTCRDWLTQAGLTVTMTGGDANIVPVSNVGMLPLFIRGEVDAAWTVEPWVSRLEMEGNGRLLYAEPPETSITTVLAVGVPGGVDPPTTSALVQAHRELTEWINNNPDEARQLVADELSRQMRRDFPLTLVEHAWPRLVFDNAISRNDFEFSLAAAISAGFIKGVFDLKGLVCSSGE